jgi:hypothetical protein
MLAFAVAVPRVGGQDARLTVAGIGLGDQAASVLERLGRADRQQKSLGMSFWEYDARGITLIWKDRSAGVQGIVVSKPAAGALDEVRVGDAAAVARARWGSPVRVRQEGRFLDFVRPGWTLSVEVVDGRIVEITLLAVN